MKAITGLAKLGTVLGMAAVLSACGGDGPSASDVRKAIEATQAEQMETLSDMVGKDAAKKMAESAPNVKIASVKDCKEADEGAYICSVEAKVSMGKDSVTKTENMKLRKDDSGKWAIVIF